MRLISNMAGYRLAMSPNQKFQLSQSIQVYKGIIAKIMIYFKLAFRQQFLDDHGKVFSLAINKKSLGHYIWRHNRCRDDGHEYAKNMRSLYKISHSDSEKEFSDHTRFTQETSYQIACRKLFSEKMSIKFNEFCDTVKQQAPFRGCFYKIRKDNKTVGYLLGTSHIGNELLLNLNPKINKALTKSLIVAGEIALDKFSLPFPKINGTLPRTWKYLGDYGVEQAGLSWNYGVECCIYKKVLNKQDAPKEFVALETEEDHNEAFKISEIKDETPISSADIINAGKIKYRIFSEFLLGIENIPFLDMNHPESVNLLKRNEKMVESSELQFQKGRTFIAVGNLHLRGDKGMNNLFTAKGYEIKRVKT